MNAHMIGAFEKLDGRIGFIWRYSEKYRVTTRGSFDSYQGKWATKFLSENYDLTGLPKELTPIVEIIFPENRIKSKLVVDYGDRRDLVLLAVVNRFTGEELSFFPDVLELANTYGFSTPKFFKFNNPTEIIEWCGKIDVNQEGVVGLFWDGQKLSRYKFKGDAYLEMHKIISDFSFKNTFEAYKNNHVAELYAKLPDEFQEQLKDWLNKILDDVSEIIKDCIATFDTLDKSDRKSFAKQATKHKEIAPILFRMFDKQAYNDLVYKLLEKKYAKKD